MRVYTSTFDHSYSSEYPGERTEYRSLADAKRWFKDFLNDRVYRWNGYDTDFPCGASDDGLVAVMDVYLDQHSDHAYVRLSRGRKYAGEWSVLEDRTF